MICVIPFAINLNPIFFFQWNNSRLWSIPNYYLQLLFTRSYLMLHIPTSFVLSDEKFQTQTQLPPSLRNIAIPHGYALHNYVPELRYWFLLSFNSGHGQTTEGVSPFPSNLVVLEVLTFMPEHSQATSLQGLNIFDLVVRRVSFYSVPSNYHCNTLLCCIPLWLQLLSFCLHPTLLTFSCAGFIISCKGTSILFILHACSCLESYMWVWGHRKVDVSSF